MRSLLNRYILSECLPPLGISLAVFTFVILMQRLLKLSDLVVAKGVPLWEVLRLLALALPPLLPLLLPMSLLLAVLLAMGRLSADSEVVAMRACGIGLGHNVRPVIALSLGVTALSLVLSVWGQPWAASTFRQALYRSVKERISLVTEEGVFTELTDGITLYADDLDERTGSLMGLFLYLDRGQTRGTWVLARRGAIREIPDGLQLDMEDGEMHQQVGSGKPYRRLRFASYRLRIPLPADIAGGREVEERPTADLLSAGYGDSRDGEARMELHRRLSLPVSCLILGFLGAPLGLHHNARSGKSRGVTVCLSVLLTFYALLTAGKALGERGVLGPAMAMWFPNAALGALSIYAYARKKREAPLPLEEALGHTLHWLQSAVRRRVQGAPTP